MDFFEEGLILGLGTTRENHYPAAGEGALHDMADSLRERLNRNLLGLIHFLSRRLFQMGCRELHLDDVSPELCGDLGPIGHHVDRGFSFFAQP